MYAMGMMCRPGAGRLCRLRARTGRTSEQRPGVGRTNMSLVTMAMETHYVCITLFRVISFSYSPPHTPVSRPSRLLSSAPDTIPVCTLPSTPPSRLLKPNRRDRRLYTRERARLTRGSPRRRHTNCKLTPTHTHLHTHTHTYSRDAPPPTCNF